MYKILSVLLIFDVFSNGQISFPSSSSSTSSQSLSGSSSSSFATSRIFPSSSQSNNNGGGSGSSSSCCRPAVKCSGVTVTARQRSGNTCTLSGGGFGVCCTPGSSSSGSNRVFESADTGFTTRNTGTRGSGGGISGAVRFGGQAVRDIGSELSRLGSPTRRSPQFYHGRFMRQARRKTKQQGDAGLFITQISQRLADNSPTQRRGQRDSSAVNFGTDNSVTRQINAECSSNSFCSSQSRYRSADGSCNNLREGRWGQTDTVLNRLVLPEYADGVQALRRDSFNRDLPSSRLVSTSWTRISDNSPDNRYTTMLMSFGQFIDHDLTHVPVLNNNGQDVDCCSRNSNTNTSAAVCAPISIPSSDNFFRGRTCMNLVRSTPGPALDCSIRYREQVNQVTHFLDLSQVYGSSQQEQNDLRQFRGGKLKTAFGPDGSILPVDNGADECKVGACMKAGDGRVNEVPPLSLLHTIFLREHNRIADQLAQTNGGNDEQIFQEARRILTAKYQHIVYNEWLPVVLGKQYMNRFGLNTLASGYSNSYSQSVDPRITNEFAAAAFRFGHTMIPGFLKVLAKIGNDNNPTLDLKSTFFKPELLRLPGMYDGLIAGLTRENSQRVDSTFSDDVTNFLFDGDPNGMDLVALNIQRGRDHGIAGYNRYRELCGLSRARSFSDLSRQMSQDSVQKIRNIYNSVDDIDLFVGMLSEFPQSDSIVGPTALCIIGDQFARLKQGDRYFYDLVGQPGSFSSSELDMIRETSLARILCDNSNVGQMQPLAFQTPGSSNPLHSCGNGVSIPFSTINSNSISQNFVSKNS